MTIGTHHTRTQRQIRTLHLLALKVDVSQAYLVRDRPRVSGPAQRRPHDGRIPSSGQVHHERRGQRNHSGKKTTYKGYYSRMIF